MQRRQALVTLGCVLGAVGLLWVGGVHAAEVPGGGKAADMPELANVGATIWNILVNLIIQLVGAIMAIVGTSKLAKQETRSAGAAGAVGGGIGMQFVPSMINGAGKAAPAAAGWLAPLSPWLAQWQGLTGQSLIIDPTVWFIVGATLYLAVRIHRRAVRLA